MPSSSSESSSSSSSKGFNGARCFWRLMMISPSFSFERTKGSKSPLSLFVLFCSLEKGQPKKKEHLSLISLFFLVGPLLFYYVTFTSRERERERERCKKEAR